MTAMRNFVSDDLITDKLHRPKSSKDWLEPQPLYLVEVIVTWHFAFLYLSSCTEKWLVLSIFPVFSISLLLFIQSLLTLCLVFIF